MKVNILQESLLQALETVLPAIKKVSLIPVFETVAITADENGLTLVGTDLETTIVTTVSATVKEAGGVCLPAHTLTDFVKTLSQGDKISMTLKDGKALVKGSSQATLAAINIEEFPPMRYPEGAALYSINAETLVAGIKRAAIAAAKGDLGNARPVLSGVNLRTKAEANRLVLAGADGFRLSVQYVPMDSTGPDVEAIIPAKAAMIIAKAFKNTAAPVSIWFEQGRVFFRGEGTAVVSQAIEGKYLDYVQIIPRSETYTEVIAPTEVVKHLCDLALVIIDPAQPAVFEAVPENGSPAKIRMSAEQKELGSTATEYDVRVNGAGIGFGMNAKYLRDAVNACGAGDVALRVSGATKPLMLFPNDGNGFAENIHVIMPYHLAEKCEVVQ